MITTLVIWITGLWKYRVLTKSWTQLFIIKRSLEQNQTESLKDIWVLVKFRNSAKSSSIPFPPSLNKRRKKEKRKTSATTKGKVKTFGKIIKSIYISSEEIHVFLSVLKNERWTKIKSETKKGQQISKKLLNSWAIYI